MNKKVIIYVSVGIALLLGFGVFSHIFNKKSAQSVSATPNETLCNLSVNGLIADINHYRSEPLLLDISLTDYANHRMNEVKLDFSHNGFIDDVFDRFDTLTGETLAKNLCKNEDVVNAWLNSPTHKEVMLDLRYNHVGISIQDRFVVAIFGDTYKKK